MTTATMASDKLEIGRVIQQTFEVLGRNFVTFLALAAILTGIPTVIVGLIQMEASETNSATAWAWFVTTGLISGVAALVLQGALTYGAIHYLNDRRVSIAESITIGLRSFLALFAVGLLYGLAVALGSLLLLVPGIMIAIAWCVAVPVLIAERKPIMDTFGRSAELTRGNRWRIFGLVLIYVVAYVIIGAIIAALSGAWLLVNGDGDVGAGPGEIAVNTVTNVISSLIGATGGAVLYTELRRVREGATPNALAAIFD
ncbi:YciC family protein [Phenylobacterium sp.]|uniref:YciC family protein n=1 Tax=Phenylobacterium sp. TaxID=1871053 RepID=UPI002FE1B856